MTGILEFCACGHSRDSHHPSGCTQRPTIREATSRLQARTMTRAQWELWHRWRRAHDRQLLPSLDELLETPRCSCRRFAVDPLLADGEVFVRKLLKTLVAKEGIDVASVEEDLLQVMRISLWRASTKYDSRSHLRFGLFASLEVYNDAIDEIRSSRLYGRNGQHRLLDYEPVQEDVAATTELPHFDMSRLAPDSRDLALALYFGYTARRIAQALNVRETEITKRKALLRLELSELGYQPVAALVDGCDEAAFVTAAMTNDEMEDAA